VFSPSFRKYRATLDRLKKMRESLGLPESVSLQLLIDEAKMLAGEK